MGPRLYKDALHCVFSFLSLADLERAMRLCRTWHSAVRLLSYVLPLRDATFPVKSFPQLKG